MLVFQSCLTLKEPKDYSLPGSSVYGILQARILQWVAIPFLQRIFPTQGLNLSILHFLHCRQILYPMRPWGSPIKYMRNYIFTVLSLCLTLNNIYNWLPFWLRW